MTQRDLLVIYLRTTRGYGNVSHVRSYDTTLSLGAKSFATTSYGWCWDGSQILNLELLHRAAWRSIMRLNPIPLSRALIVLTQMPL